MCTTDTHVFECYYIFCFSRSYSTLSVASTRSSLASDLHDITTPTHSPMPPSQLAGSDHATPTTIETVKPDQQGVSTTPPPPPQTEGEHLPPLTTPPEITIIKEEEGVANLSTPPPPVDGAESAATQDVENTGGVDEFGDFQGVESSVRLAQDTSSHSQNSLPDTLSDKTITPDRNSSDNTATEAQVLLGQQSSEMMLTELAEFPLEDGTVESTVLTNTTPNIEGTQPVGGFETASEARPPSRSEVSQSLDQSLHQEGLPSAEKPVENDIGNGMPESTLQPRSDSVTSKNNRLMKQDKSEKLSLKGKSKEKTKSSKKSGKKESRRSRGAKKESQTIDDTQSEMSYQPDTDLSRSKASKKAFSKSH